MHHAHARRRLSPLIAALLAMLLALAPALGAMARAHELLHEAAGAPMHGPFHGTSAHDGHCAVEGACADDDGGLHRMAHAVDCCAHVVAALPAALNAHGAPPGGSPAPADVAARSSLSSQPLLEPPIR